MVAIEPFSFLSIILKLLNLPDDVKKDTIKYHKSK